MASRLADAVSPYLRSHAGNPVDWFPWGDAAFAAAAARDVPVLVSIGYSTCHWCHVMARESFSDPTLAAYLNAHFVAIKVDREEHPEVDAAYLAAAGAFTEQLGWPLNVFVTPAGRAFFAGTYSPPVAGPGQPAFRQVLEAVVDAWTTRRDELDASAARLVEALAAATAAADADAATLTAADLQQVAVDLAAFEDTAHGGFGGAPKFPVAPTLLTALALGRSTLLQPDVTAGIRAVALRALDAMRDGGLRDTIEGGFFRYATRRDWSEPHYERMLTDNALLLRAYAEAGDRATAAGIVDFLRDVLWRKSGGFGSAQDSESLIDGQRTEGVYYALDAAARALQSPPAVDGKVLTGWNGLAIGALAHAGTLLGEPGWVALAATAADALLAQHRLTDGTLRRASLDGRPSAAAATLEDYGALADGLIEVALAAGRVDLAVAARELVDACVVTVAGDTAGFAARGGGDPTLAAFGIAGDADPNEGASPSGITSIARAAWQLYVLTGERRYLDLSTGAIAPFMSVAVRQPIGFGALLGLAAEQLEPIRQLVVVTASGSASTTEAPLLHAARSVPTTITAVVDEPTADAFATAGFDLFAGRATSAGSSTAYLCREFVCRLPIVDAEALLDAATNVENSPSTST